MVRLAFLLLIFLFSFPVHSKIFRVTEPKALGPLSTRSQSPLYIQFISDPLEKAETLPRRRFSSSLDFTRSNLFERRRKAAGMGIDLDMELYRTGLSFHYGLLDGYEIGMEF